MFFFVCVDDPCHYATKKLWLWLLCGIVARVIHTKKTQKNHWFSFFFFSRGRGKVGPGGWGGGGEGGFISENVITGYGISSTLCITTLNF